LRKTLTLSALLLVLSLGVVWSATASAPVAPSGLSGLSGAEMRTKPTPTPTPTPTPSGPCTVTCPFIDPAVSCSSEVGDCHLVNAKGTYLITCDGHTQICPDPFF
jgi:hypothetical protein